jgi:hypothetical protein
MTIDGTVVVVRCSQLSPSPAAVIADVASPSDGSAAARGIAAVARIGAAMVSVHGSPGCGLGNNGSDARRQSSLGCSLVGGGQRLLVVAHSIQNNRPWLRLVWGVLYAWPRT